MAKMRGVLMTIVIVWGSLAQIWPKMFALEADRATTGRTVIGIVFHPAVTWIAGAVLVVWLIHRRTDKREQAHEHLTIATTIYREMGMTYWLEKAEAEMTKPGG